VTPEYTVHTLRLGTIRLDKSMTVDGCPPGTVLEVPIWAAAVEGNGHRFLVDTGLAAPEKWSKMAPHWLEDGQNIHSELAELGWRTADVDFVINSHLHYDHAENNLAFPHAQFYVSRAEWDFSRDSGTGQAALYDFEWTSPQVTYMNYSVVSVDHYDVMPGVRLIQTPGHTPGHQSVLVQTAEGVLCVAGDAACMMENLTLPAAPGAHTLRSAALESIEKIVTYSDRILMNHDPELKRGQSSGFPITPT
jgi:glyoxylase-like metal-dependent hydrolase (beta-lactamase superfamily II)